VAARRKKKTKKVEDYRHKEAERLNNPPAGLAWQDTEKPVKRRFEYDPRLDPQLVWAGKAERQSFEVEAPSIHVHERLSADDIIRSVMKQPAQPALFDYEELDRKKTVDFYRHEMGWENRLILGDSLVVMTSLLEKERLGGQVQMIYIDPPYGIDYKANFQPRISSREVKEGSGEHLTREPEQIQAFRDTWNHEVHSYLTYMRDRILLAFKLLSESGSLILQIGPQNVHLVRALLDEVFGAGNALPMITIAKTSQEQTRLLPDVADYLLWYAKQKESVKYRALFAERELPINDFDYRYVEEPSGERRPMTAEEQANPRKLLDDGGRIYRLDNATSEGFSAHKTVDFTFADKVFHPGPNRHWLLRVEGMEGLGGAGRLAVRGKSLAYVRFWDDFGAIPRTNVWTDTGQAGAWGRKKAYVVETNPKILERCIAMTTDPGDLVVDPTCGSGTTAWAAEKLGRRWITIDTSRVAVTLTRERLATSKFDFFQLLDEQRGVDAGLKHRELSRTKASSIGYGELADEVVNLADQPLVDSSRIRVSGPFTVEALSRYAVNPNQENVPPEPADPQAEEPQDHVEMLLDALRKQGIPRKGGQPLTVEFLEGVTDAGAIQAYGHCDEPASGGDTRAFAVSIGPRFGPVTVQQIE
jgi:adenine-specific DNA-methyltransferase